MSTEWRQQNAQRWFRITLEITSKQWWNSWECISSSEREAFRENVVANITVSCLARAFLDVAAARAGGRLYPEIFPSLCVVMQIVAFFLTSPSSSTRLRSWKAKRNQSTIYKYYHIRRSPNWKALGPENLYPSPEHSEVLLTHPSWTNLHPCRIARRPFA